MRDGPSTPPTIKPYRGPSGGYGSLKSVASVLKREEIMIRGAETLAHQNKPSGFMCVSCAWGKPAVPHPFEYCENGAKATAWEITPKRVDEAFFADHTLAELETWLDYDLEESGRLTHPMRYDAATDRYLPVPWEQAFAEIGQELRALHPDQAIFYTSGRASLETSYMYQLLARMYGTNNLPDCSNMCHESTSVALPESIGASVGTVSLHDFEQTDLMFYIAHNPATSSPRILHELQDARKRGAKLIAINPLRERGLERFTNPQAPDEMITLSETQIATDYLQVKLGGDIALLTAICKTLIAWDDAAQAAGEAAPTDRDAILAQTPDDAAFSIQAAAAGAKNRRVLDHDFIQQHTHGFDAFAQYCRDADWDDLIQVSGIDRDMIKHVADQYAKSERCMILYGMGLTQHVAGVEGIHMVTNLLLLRGNIGKAGTGVCPIRGHSNVQGQRTVGITEKPELVPLDHLAEQYGFEPPRHKGWNTVEACDAMIDGRARAFIALGGNFIRAVPDLPIVEAAWRKMRLTVAIATKLNRSHVVHGEIAYVLPCLGRIEIDMQATGPQSVSIESSLAHFHGSRGHVKPAAPGLLSEAAIVAGLARATLDPNPLVPWESWVADYGRVRRAIEATYPATFKGLDENMFQPGGITRPIAARERKWTTRTGRANFLVPTQMFMGAVASQNQPDILQLATLRSNDQFNTTIYGYHDRFRGVTGTRMVIFMNQKDMRRLGFVQDDIVDATTAMDETTPRTVHGLQVVEYNIPEGCVGAYYPETNPLVPLHHHDKQAHTPAYKAIPIRLTRSQTQSRTEAA